MENFNFCAVLLSQINKVKEDFHLIKSLIKWLLCGLIKHFSWIYVNKYFYYS